MNKTTTYGLLPGFDGTGGLYQGLIHELGDACEFVVVRYSNNNSLSEYIDEAISQIPNDKDIVLVAESFSGPIAVEIVARQELDVRGLVLSATFLKPPMKPAIELGLKMPIFPKSVKKQTAKRFCLNGVDRDDVVRAVNASVADMSKSTIKSRLNALLEMDAAAAAKRCEIPVLYLQASQDRLISSARSDDVVNSLGNCEREIINAPHLLFQVNPERAAESIRQWVKDVFSR